MSVPTPDLNRPAPANPHNHPGATATTRGGAGLGTAALALGIPGIVFSLIPHVTGFGIFLGLVGLVLGIIGIRRQGRRVVTGTVVAAAAVLIGSIFSGVYSGGGDDAAAPALPSTSAKQDAGATAKAPPAANLAKPKGSAGQLQALAAANSYLSSGLGFSQASLLDQLTSDAGNGFPAADAKWAIDHAKPDWNAQALSASKGYLKSGVGFSAASLTAQLTSSAGNQFTPEQAQNAVAHSAADWNEQAVLAAKGYTSSGIGFSRSSLIEQLTSPAGNQFTQEQAQYAADQVGLR